MFILSQTLLLFIPRSVSISASAGRAHIIDPVKLVWMAGAALADVV